MYDWSSKADLVKAFRETSIVGMNVLFASYAFDNEPSDEGDAWVLFEKDGILYEVNGGHCSCYGLEGQWEPEEVNLKELEHRLKNGTWGEDWYTRNQFKRELCNFLGLDIVIKGQ